ncbi:HEAT repeat domain-containing protein [Halorussus amylolyticus]|uniref:HEAT repeat domain-containing protein n=1 Tax=Halorussus amylolyticus TaxID=1126242 RepID=UPI00104F29EA|nr:HEAT repeat domain-containing protein [Halorussus amylolyticus]
MDSPPDRPPVERLTDLVKEGDRDEAVACLERFETASADGRKAALGALRSLADERPVALEPLTPTLRTFLADDDRAVRLRTAKLFVALAEATPDAVVPVAPALAERLADPDELYFVRARAAETLGYVALEHPESVASPEVLADLRIGLSFDEPEVKEKLAKALEHVAIGNPGRLEHHVSNVAEHLGDESELVRYHLSTALVVVGCEHPDALAEARTRLGERLDDENAHVRGRAAEALGLLARLESESESESEEPPIPEPELRALADDEQFVAERARFAASALGGDEGPDSGRFDGVGTVGAIRATTDEIVAELTTADSDECPNCGLALPEESPPMCPRCGAAY